MSTTAPPAALRRGVLSSWEVLAQSVANIAPTATPTVVVPLVFAYAAGGSWAAYLFALVAISLVAVLINQFAKRSSSPGNLYTYVALGLGPTAAATIGWALFIAYVGTASAVTGGFANYVEVFAREALGLDGVFVPDHILAKPATTQHYGGHWPDPFSLLAFLAGRTRRIQLGASVIVLDQSRNSGGPLFHRVENIKENFRAEASDELREGTAHECEHLDLSALIGERREHILPIEFEDPHFLRDGEVIKRPPIANGFNRCNIFTMNTVGD